MFRLESRLERNPPVREEFWILLTPTQRYPMGMDSKWHNHFRNVSIFCWMLRMLWRGTSLHSCLKAEPDDIMKTSDRITEIVRSVFQLSYISNLLKLIQIYAEKKSVRKRNILFLAIFTSTLLNWATGWNMNKWMIYNNMFQQGEIK